MTERRRVVGEEVPGAVFRKTYRGNTYELLVVGGGERWTYRMGDELYRTPTAAALAITGYKTINGRAFWGMPKKA